MILIGVDGMTLPDWAATRGLPIEVCEARGLYIADRQLYNKWPKMKDRIVFLNKSLTGRIVGGSGRATLLGQEPKYWVVPGFNKNNYIYGLERRDPSRPVWAVEGQCDVLALDTVGALGYAIAGSSISPYQCALIAGMSPVCCVYPDSDNLALRWADPLKRFGVQVIHPSEPFPGIADPIASKMDPASYMQCCYDGFKNVVRSCEEFASKILKAI
jgi:hypothetical protein